MTEIEVYTDYISNFNALKNAPKLTGGVDYTRALEQLKNHIQQRKLLKNDIFYQDYELFLTDCIHRYFREFDIENDYFFSKLLEDKAILIYGIPIIFDKGSYYEMLFLLVCTIIPDDFTIESIQYELACTEHNVKNVGGYIIVEEEQKIQDESGNYYIMHGYVERIEERLINFINNM